MALVHLGGDQTALSRLSHRISQQQQQQKKEGGQGRINLGERGGARGEASGNSFDWSG